MSPLMKWDVQTNQSALVQRVLLARKFPFKQIILLLATLAETAGYLYLYIFTS